MRVVLHNGDQLGVMSVREALVIAKEHGLDLVEVAATADPPVCRVIDYGKYKYEQKKLKKAQKPAAATKMKEIKFRVRTEKHDYELKVAHAEKFLDAGHKVRLQLQFRGRENAHKELGFVVLERVVEDLKSMANVEQPPRLAGRAIAAVLTPLPAHQRVRKFAKSKGLDIDNLAAMEDQDDFDHEEEE